MKEINMTKHSLLSASSAYKWKDSPAEACYNMWLVNKTSQAAERGTFLHKILSEILDSKNYEFININNLYKISIIRDNDVNDTYDLSSSSYEQLSSILLYLDRYKEKQLQKHKQYLETKIYYNEWLDIEDKDMAFGTADIAYIEETKTSGSNAINVHIFDAKFGQVPVNVKNNYQLALYALGFISFLKERAVKVNKKLKINNIILGILQPGIGVFTETVKLKDLVDLIEPLKKSAKRAVDIYKGREVLSISDFSEYPAKYSVSQGVYNLRLCALAKQIDINDLPIGDISSCLDMAFKLKKWCGDVIEQATTILENGEVVEGFELIDGRKKPLKWKNGEDAVIKLGEYVKQNDLDEETFISKTLLSPVQTLNKLQNEFGLSKENAEDLVAGLVTRDEANKVIAKIKLKKDY